MKTEFGAAALADPAMASSEAIVRKCVRCGMCTATCPTYALLGDELDSPRGRIYLIKDMLEGEKVPSPVVVKHVDRCLSCLSCMTSCPSGVNYMHLVDHARSYIEEHYRRPVGQRLLRGLLAQVLPHRGRFRFALTLARFARPMRPLLRRIKPLRPVDAMLALAPDWLPAPHVARDALVERPRGRIALLHGCAEPVLRPEYQAAAIRLVNRLGYDVVAAPGEGCCGALVHHLGRERESLAQARRNIDAWVSLADAGGLDAILATASGCGTTIKDYGHMLRGDPIYAGKARRVSALAKDITEFLAGQDLPEGEDRGLAVAYHAACSLQHGQKVVEAPKTLLARAGYRVLTPAEAHLCCGSAGTYNILQPDIAAELGRRKAASLERLDADVVATGNIGCATQLALHGGRPVVHTIELLDWAFGGPAPAALEQHGSWRTTRQSPAR